MKKLFSILIVILITTVISNPVFAMYNPDMENDTMEENQSEVKILIAPSSQTTEDKSELSSEIIPEDTAKDIILNTDEYQGEKDVSVTSDDLEDSDEVRTISTEVETDNETTSDNENIAETEDTIDNEENMESDTNSENQGEESEVSKVTDDKEEKSFIETNTFYILIGSIVLVLVVIFFIIANKKK